MTDILPSLTGPIATEIREAIMSRDAHVRFLESRVLTLEATVTKLSSQRPEPDCGCAPSTTCSANRACPRLHPTV